MKAIQTGFRNELFKSRLEAKWAVFFYCLGIEYVYEPEGFTNGRDKYLPDFYLPKVKSTHHDEGSVYLEIKPRSYAKTEVTNGNASKWFTKPLVLCVGSPIECLGEDYGDNESPYITGSGIWDNYHRLAYCYNCGTAQFRYDKYLLDCHKCCNNSDMHFGGEVVRILAYAAHNAEFKQGGRVEVYLPHKNKKYRIS